MESSRRYLKPEDYAGIREKGLTFEAMKKEGKIAKDVVRGVYYWIGDAEL